MEILEDIKKIPEVGIVDLSRYFVKEIAITAGLDHCNGDAAIIMDTDLQNAPSLIPTLIDNWQNGDDVVYTVNESRVEAQFNKSILTKTFYKIINYFSYYQIPKKPEISEY